ncbi:MAG: glutaminase [Corynebacterium sp.]|nr:glutaminase [Corynebacterium sp.]
MKTPIPFYLQELLENVRDNKDGEVADYIPDLANADPELLGAALCTTTGHVYSAGDDDVEFTLQSISKPFVYALALQELGLEAVREVVGMEPSGEAFNELSLNDEDHRPVNPMINAGAIAVTQLINGVDSGVDERVARIKGYLSRLAGRELNLDEKVCGDELEHADRNLSLAHMLRNYDIIKDSARDAVLTYTRQCSLKVTVKDLAVMAATLANGGVQPVTDDRILSPDVCRLTLAVMSSAGMYNGAGRWMAEVGIPAKSGVSGGLLGTLPGQLGFATFSPRLNAEGNSVRGVAAFSRLSSTMGLHLMNTEERYGIRPIRAIDDYGASTVFRLQGVINFNAAETILHQLEDYDVDGDAVALDFTHVTASNTMGRRMLKEGLRRFREQGFAIGAIDPEGRLEDLSLADGTKLPISEPEEFEEFDDTAAKTSLEEEL